MTGRGLHAKFEIAEKAKMIEAKGLKSSLPSFSKV